MSSSNQVAGPAEVLATGVIGLGMIGSIVAAGLARQRMKLSVFDVRPDASDHLQGVEPPLARPAEVAMASDVILIAVVDADQVRDVLTGEGGILTVGKAGLMVVILSTLAVSTILEFGAVCAAHGATLLDAGVTQSGQGMLVTMVGGPEDAVSRVLPVLNAFSKAVIHCGGVGAGMVTKIARNLVTYSNWAVMREAVSMAVAGGVKPETLLEVMQSASGEGTSQLMLLKLQAAGGEWPAAQVTSIDGLAQKDLAAAQAFAGEAGIEIPIGDVVRSKMVETLSGRFADPLPDGRWERGIATAKKVYGAKLGEQLDGAPRVPALVDTIEHLFGEIWARGHLTIRDKRLLLIGATTMIGRKDLLEVQLRGALENRELTVPQLREMELFLNYYTSFENGTAFLAAAEGLIAAVGADD